MLAFQHQRRLHGLAARILKRILSSSTEGLYRTNAAALSWFPQLWVETRTVHCTLELHVSALASLRQSCQEFLRLGLWLWLEVLSLLGRHCCCHWSLYWTY